MGVDSAFDYMTDGAACHDDPNVRESHPAYMTAFGGPLAYDSTHQPGARLEPNPQLQTGGQSDTFEAKACRCSVCGKQFVRPCDLNKHSKTHSRPHKCPVQGCRYQHHGWPTEKELERHFNDKHASQPRMFACLEPSCTYESKRESNCKQHMEKRHGYSYERSRPLKSYRCPHPDCSDCATTEESRQNHVQALPQADVASYLAASHHASAPMLAFDGAVSYTPQASENQALADSIVPWTSPFSRDQHIQEQIREVDSVYPGFPVDPRLHAPQYPHAIEDSPARGPPDMETPEFQKALLTPHLKRSCSPPPHLLSSSSPPAISHPGDASKGSVGGDQAASRGDTELTAAQSALRLVIPQGKQSTGDGTQQGDGGGDDGEPPKKRARVQNEDGGDEQMPCPFHKSDPAFFNRSRKEKFSPCHTKHKDISTIARHLSRAAHKLDVTEASISSFDVQDEEKSYPRAGLCRRCWRPFRIQAEFDHHVSLGCSRVSRGKMEKFYLIFYTFCMDPDSQQENTMRYNSHSATEVAPSGPSTAYETAPLTGIPASNPSSAFDLKPDMAGGDRLLAHAGLLGQERPVTWSEHLALVDRVRRLEAENKKLNAALASRTLQVVQGGGSAPLSQPSAPNASIPLSAPAALSRGHSFFDPDENRTASTAQLDEGQIKGRLARPMGSRLARADRDGRVMSEPDRPRTNSGLSSSTHSTVRHISPFETPRFGEPEVEEGGGGDGDDDDDDDGDKAQRPRAEAKTPQRQGQPTSDSGYGSTKHTSLSFGAGLAPFGPMAEGGGGGGGAMAVDIGLGSQFEPGSEPRSSQERLETHFDDACAWFNPDSQGQSVE